MPVLDTNHGHLVDVPLQIGGTIHGEQTLVTSRLYSVQVEVEEKH